MPFCRDCFAEFWSVRPARALYCPACKRRRKNESNLQRRRESEHAARTRQAKEGLGLTAPAVEVEPEPCPHAPGSPGKIAALRERLEKRVAMHSPKDARGYDG